MRALYVRGGGPTGPTSEPKIVVVNLSSIFQFGYPNAASVWNPLSDGTDFRMAICLSVHLYRYIETLCLATRTLFQFIYLEFHSN